MDGSSDFEQEVPPDFCDTPELQAAWRRVEAFDASQPVCEKLADLAKTLARVAEIRMLEIVAPQIEALRAQGERNPLSDDERRQLAKLDDLRATLDEEVCNGLRRLRSFDS